GIGIPFFACPDLFQFGQTLWKPHIGDPIGYGFDRPLDLGPRKAAGLWANHRRSGVCTTRASADPFQNKGFERSGHGASWKGISDHGGISLGTDRQISTCPWGV